MSKPILPPPVWFLLSLLGVWSVSGPFAIEALDFESPLDGRVAQGLAMLGLALGLVAIAQFLHRKTTVHPMHPEEASALVTGGIYRLTRNPMYVCMLLILLAAVLHFGNWLGLVPVTVFVLVIQLTQILPEERALADKFGDDYRAYKARVPRWLIV
ncbi:methyltransferase family protein [Parvularcula lutaonensis]|uniref:Methyltransferase family protein n=1 Tax=Parvularcula lutaonensis TaxID=491923 RepID=A0ABV7M966_9PROT|nr:isoprenylcysteine carboxylmethyltransferase family protein [Parvularcula lutaonensis]GGY46348.1 hypothetical protein GCM10007148_14320 [Parvularcula lutaonensis]